MPISNDLFDGSIMLDDLADEIIDSDANDNSGSEVESVIDGKREDKTEDKAEDKDGDKTGNESVKILKKDLKSNQDPFNAASKEKRLSGFKVQNDLCDDINAGNVPETLEEIELQLDRLKRKWGEVTYLIGQRLQIINDRKLFREKGYQDFATYVRLALQMSDNNAYYYIAVYEYFTEEQTKSAGSKLKLIIPVLNKIKKDKDIPEEIRNEKIKDLTSELYTKINNKSYREAEKLIKCIRERYFTNIDKTGNKFDNEIESKTGKKNISHIDEFDKIVVKNDRIIILEKDKDIQNELVQLITQFYS
jgi:hypothetical protein